MSLIDEKKHVLIFRMFKFIMFFETSIHFKLKIIMIINCFRKIKILFPFKIHLYMNLMLNIIFSQSVFK
jgi:hypothetical protein